MYVLKSFNGLTAVGGGPEVEPGSNDNSMNEIPRQLTTVAYDLFQAQQDGSTIDYEAITALLAGDTSVSEVVHFPRNEVENTRAAELLKQMLTEHATDFSYAQGMLVEEVIARISGDVADGASVYTDNRRHIQNLDKVREEMLSGGVQITDKLAFIQSLREAVAASDQGGLESYSSPDR